MDVRTVNLTKIAATLEDAAHVLCTCPTDEQRVLHETECRISELASSLREHAASLDFCRMVVLGVLAYLENELEEVRKVTVPDAFGDWQDSLGEDERRVRALQTIVKLLNATGHTEGS